MTDEYEKFSFDNLEKNKVKCNPKYGIAWKFMTIVKNMLLKEKNTEYLILQTHSM